MKEKILKLTLLLLGVFITAIAIFIMPDLSKLMARSLSDFSFLRKPGLALIYLSLIPFYLVLFKSWGLVDLVYGQEIFSDKAIKALETIRRACFLIFLTYGLALLSLIILGVPFTTAYLTILILALAALSLGLIASLTIRLVKIAKDYKEENDLTI